MDDWENALDDEQPAEESGKTEAGAETTNEEVTEVTEDRFQFTRLTEEGTERILRGGEEGGGTEVPYLLCPGSRRYRKDEAFGQDPKDKCAARRGRWDHATDW